MFDEKNGPTGNVPPAVHSTPAHSYSASMLFKPAHVDHVSALDTKIQNGETITTEALIGYCNKCLEENLSHIPPLHTLIQLVRKFEEKDEQFISKFNELLVKKPLVAVEILRNAASIWTDAISHLQSDEKIQNIVNAMYLIYRRMPQEFKKDPTFFYQVTEQLKPSNSLYNQFNRKVLEMLLQETYSSPNVATALDNIGSQTLEDEVLLNYCKYLLTKPNNPSVTALKKLVARLSTDEGYEKFGDVYHKLLERPGMAEKFVTTPELLYGLSTETHRAKHAKRENRIIAACKAYLAEVAPSPEVTNKLAYDLLTTFADEPDKIDVIFDTLREAKYAKTPHLTELVGRPGGIKAGKEGSLREVMKKVVGAEKFVDIKKKLKEPETAKALWFQKGRMLLAAAGSRELNDAEINEVKQCFERAFAIEKGDKQSSVNVSDDMSTVEMFGRQNMAFRASVINAPTPTALGSDGSVLNASHNLDAMQLKGIVAILLKTKLPQHEGLWQFFSDTMPGAIDSIYTEKERRDLTLYLLDALFPADKSKIPNIDPTIWSEAMKFLLAQVKFLKNKQAIEEKIDNLRGSQSTTEEEKISDKLLDLFKDKPVTSLHKIIFGLMSASTEALPQTISLLNSLSDETKRQEQIKILVAALIKPATPEVLQSRIHLLVSLLADGSLSKTIKIELISSLKVEISAITNDEERKEELDSNFVSKFMNTVVTTMENTKADPDVLRMLSPEQWYALKKEWGKTYLESAAKFMANVLSQQTNITESTMEYLNQRKSSSRAIILKRFMEIANPDAKVSLLLALNIGDFNGKETLDVVVSMFTYLENQDEIVGKSEWNQLKDTLLARLKNISDEDINGFENIDVIQKNINKWSQLEAEIITALKTDVTKRYLLALLPIEKQNDVIRHWLQSDASEQQIERWIGRFNDAERIQLALSSTTTETNKSRLQKILLSNPALYTSTQITSEQFSQLYALDSATAQDRIQHLLVSDAKDSDKEAIYLRVLEMTAKASVDNRDQAIAYLISVKDNFALAWSVLQRTDDGTHEELDTFLIGSSFGNSAIQHHVSQAILAHATPSASLSEGSYARKFATSVDFWMSYFDKKNTSQLPKLHVIMSRLTTDEKMQLFAEARKRIADLKKLDPKHLQEILLAYSEAAKNDSILIAALSEVLVGLYLSEDKSILAANGLLNALDELKMDEVLIQKVLAALMNNGTLIRTLPEAIPVAATISEKNFNRWLAVLSSEEQEKIFLQTGSTKQANKVLQWAINLANVETKKQFLLTLLPKQNLDEKNSKLEVLLISVASDDRAIVEIFEKLDDAQKTTLLTNSKIIEALSVVVLNTILATIKDTVKKEGCCNTTLMDSHFESNPTLKKHEFALLRHISLEKCQQNFDSYTLTATERTANDLAQIRRFGTMLLSTNEGLSFLLSMPEATMDDNKQTRLVRFQKHMTGQSITATNPFWFTAEMIETIPGKMLKGVFEHSLLLDEQHPGENKFIVQNVFEAMDNPEGTYVKSSNRPVGNILLLKSMIEHLTEQMEKQDNDGLPILTVKQMEQVQAHLDEAWNRLATNLGTLKNEQWQTLPEETRLSLLSLLGDKMADFLMLYETTKKNTVELSVRMGQTDEKSIEPSPELSAIRKNSQRIQQIEWPLFQQISPLYEQLMTNTFVAEGLPDLFTPEGESYWKLCTTGLLSLNTLVIENPKNNDCQSLVEDSVVTLVIMLLNVSSDSRCLEKWKAFQIFFEALREKNTIDGFGLLGLVDAFNAEGVIDHIDSIPLESVDWLVHQVADETGVNADVFAALMNRYTTAILAGNLVLKEGDNLFERKNIANKFGVRQAIFQAIAENKEIIHEHPERMPIQLRTFFMRYCHPDGIIQNNQTLIAVLVTLLQLPESLYNEEQKSMVEWTQKIEQALASLNSQDRDAVVPLFQTLLAYYSQDLQGSKDVIFDKFAEVSDKIAVFFGVSVDKLLEKCDTATKLALVDEAFSGLKAYRTVGLQAACNTLAGVKNYRQAFFGDGLVNIPNNARDLSYADGDSWHVFYIKEEKKWAVIGRIPNNIAGAEPPVIEFLATFGEEGAAPTVYHWQQHGENGQYIPYSSPEIWQATLGKDTTRCLTHIATIKEEENKAKKIRQIILQAPSLSETRRQRSARLIQQWMQAATDAPEKDAFKQGVLNKVIHRNALAEINPELGQAVVEQIQTRSVKPISITELDAQGKQALANLEQLRVEYVILTDWITNPTNIAGLSSAKITFSDCMNALRERLPVLVKVGKDTAEQNKRNIQQQINDLQKKSDAELGELSAVVHLNDTDVVLGRFHVISKTVIDESIIEQLANADDQAFQLICQNNGLVYQELPKKVLLVRETKDKTGSAIEIMQDGYSKGQVFLSNKEKNLLDSPSANLERRVQQLHLQAQLDRETWNAQRAKQFSADDHLIITINRLRENIQELETRNPNLARQANEVLSAYLNSEYHDQYAAKTMTAWLTRGFEDVVRKMIGGDVAQCESVLSQFLSQHRFNVAKTWDKQKQELPQQDVYIYRHGKRVSVASIAPAQSTMDGDRRQYTLTWKKDHEATEQVCRYYQAMRECEQLEAKAETIQRLIDKNTALKSTLYIVPYGYLPKVLEGIKAEIAQKRAVPAPDQKTIESALKPGQTLYDKHGKCLGVLNSHLSLEQDLLYGEDAWYQILVSQSLEELKAAESSINVAVLDVIHRGYLTELLTDTFKEEKKHFIIRRVQQVILESKPFLSYEDSKELVKSFSTEAAVQLLNAYQNRNDVEGQKTRQALMSALLASPKHMPYFLATEDRKLALWKHLTQSGFSKEAMLALLQSLTTDKAFRVNPQAEQISQFVRAAYFTLAVEHPHQIQINAIRLEQLPLTVIRQIPKHVRNDIFIVAENFECLQQSHYFNALSDGFTADELREKFVDFLTNGFNRFGHNHENIGNGLTAFYRNVDEKLFWTIFNETIPSTHLERKKWIEEGMFGNPSFMRAVSENLGKDSVVKLAWHDANKVVRNVGEQLGLLEKLSDRYASFTIDEIMQLVDHYQEHPSEEVQTFLADWLFLQLQSGQLRVGGETARTEDEQNQAYLDALVWDEHGGIELVDLEKHNQAIAPPSNVSTAQIKPEHLNSLLSLVGNKAFHGMMTAKYALTKSNLEKLVKEKARRDAGDFATFYDTDTTGSKKFSLEAAQTNISLSLSGSWNNRAWVTVKAVDYALLESARQAQKKSPVAKQQRDNWKALLDDYVGSVGNVWNKRPRSAEAVLSQLSEVRKTVVRLLASGNITPAAAEDSLNVMLDRKNFLLLMKMYKENVSKDDDQKICDEIELMLGSMFASNPTQFLSALSAVDRKTEWDFAIKTLGLQKMLEGKTDEQLKQEITADKTNRRRLIAGIVVVATGTGAALGTVTTGAPIKGAFVGAAAGLATGVVIEASGQAKAATRQVYHTIRDVVTAAYNNMSPDDQNSVRNLYKHKQFEEKEQAKQRTWKIFGKSGFVASWRRFSEYRPDVYWMKPFYTVAVWMGVMNEPKSSLINSYRATIPTVYIGSETDHNIAGNAILLTLQKDGSYTCRFYNNGVCINADNVTQINLQQYTTLLSKVKLSPQTVSKKDRELFGEMLKDIESARNDAILQKEATAKQGYYDTTRTLVQDEQTGKATDKAIQHDLKNFSELKQRLAMIPVGVNSPKGHLVNARMHAASLRAAVDLVNLTQGGEKAQVSLNNAYKIPNGVFSRLWNGLTSWYTGNRLIEKHEIQTLKSVLNEVLHQDEPHVTEKPADTSRLSHLQREDNIQIRDDYLLLPKRVKMILNGSLLAPGDTHPPIPLQDSLLSSMREQSSMMNRLIEDLEKKINDGSDLTPVIADLECRLSGLVKMAMRVYPHEEVRVVMEYCKKIHELIDTKPAAAEKLKNMMTNIQYTCSHTAERLMIRRLENLQAALENTPQSQIRDDELKAVKKEQWAACKRIVEVYPEDTEVRKKFNELSSTLGLPNVLDCEKDFSLTHDGLQHEQNRWRHEAFGKAAAEEAVAERSRTVTTEDDEGSDNKQHLHFDNV